MTRIDEALGSVVQMRSTRRAVVPAKPATMPPDLPSELLSEADLLAGNIRFGDMVLSQEARFRPEAEGCAAKIRAAMAPAPIEVVRAWLTDLVKRLGPGPIPPHDLFDALVDTCGDMPALCWSPVTRREVTRKFKFLPVVAELVEVLDAEARKWRGRAMAFERMAKAKREPEPDWRKREAPVRSAGLPAASPSPEPAPEAPRPSVPLRTVEEQLAAYGQTPESAATALAERRKKFGQ